MLSIVMDQGKTKISLVRPLSGIVKEFDDDISDYIVKMSNVFQFESSIT